MSAQNSAGIQTLLDAEREASKIVQKCKGISLAILVVYGPLIKGLPCYLAREFRTKRVKEARDEAKKEITDYKAKKEDEYKKFEAEHSKGNKEAEAEANKEADKQIKQITEAGKSKQDAVVKKLLSAVFDVNPIAPTSV
ncbi:Vacuolar (H+)-ATPase G subunit [Cordyceps fumosorosea ARSEF 2679]|uniref:V-type proton ATPase subunit G n=1 Tax=Cordyceps fumosorosea (strain ARSEF 2679) TaxID=1081104 RepID=A0A167GVT0_CORFA|nr:Vacuolar (H+)-ATPase G subunit [Cordyceps fumosorosea ARSEF 2679]OAA47165.1 Vacuolar (H+)-ATPase G subunit [Cordyceps fumosorosea ARSEF 2679]